MKTIIAIALATAMSTTALAESFPTEWNTYVSATNVTMNIMTTPCDAVVDMGVAGSYCAVWPVNNIFQYLGEGATVVDTPWDIYVKNGTYELAVMDVKCDGFLVKDAGKYCLVLPEGVEFVTYGNWGSADLSPLSPSVVGDCPEGYVCYNNQGGG